MLTAETRTVTEESLITSAQTQNIQNPANIKLLQSILDRNDDNFDEALDEGADPNASGLFLPNRKKPKMAPPLLILALVQQNHAQAMTLIKRGAKVDVYGDDGAPAIQMVVELFGDESLVPLMIDQEPALLDQGGNLLMGALVSFNSLTMLREMSLLEDKSFLNSFDDYFEGKTRIPPTPPAELYYTSNTAMIELLLKRAAYQVHRKVACTKNGEVKADISPFELVQNPRHYVQLFHNSGLGCRYLAEETLKEPDPKVLLFEVEFYPAWEPNKQERANSIPRIKIRYDFNPLYKRLEFAARQQTEVLHKQQLGLAQGLHMVKQNVVNINNHVQVIQQDLEQNTLQLQQHAATLQKHEAELEHLRTGMLRLATIVDQAHPLHAQIENLRKDPYAERLFDNLCIDLYAKLAAYGVLSSGEIQRNKNKPLDYASQAFSALSNQLPSPFGIPFGLTGLIVGKVSDIKEQNRCQSIKKCVGTEAQSFVQALAYQLTLDVQKYFKESGYVLADLKNEHAKPYQAIDQLSKQVFGAAVYQIYDINNLGIDMSLSLKNRNKIFLDRIMVGVRDAVFWKEFIAERLNVEVLAFTPGFSDLKNSTAIQVVQQANQINGNHAQSPKGQSPNSKENSPTKTNGTSKHSTSSSESPQPINKKKVCSVM